MGTILAAKYKDMVRNMTGSYMVRLVQDHFSPVQGGFFYAALSGRNLGNFDLVFDPRNRDSILIGQVAWRDNRQYFDTWANFAARSFRTGARTPLNRDISTEKIRIEASFGPDLSMQANTRLNFTANNDGNSVLPFEISKRMRVTEATLDGEPVEVFARESMRANLARGENELLLVVTPAPFVKGRKYALELKHEGNVVTQAGNGVYFVGARTTWYPNRDAEFADYELVFHHPKNLTLVATGELAGEKVEGEVRTAVHKTSSPIRFAGFNLGEYRKTESVRAGIKIEVCANRRVEASLHPRTRDVVVMPQPGRGFPPLR
jgi:hypothetical protein